MIHLDTHVVVWLYKGDVTQFPPTVVQRLEMGPLVISPIVILELNYLYEIGRTSVPGQDVIAHLEQRIGLQQSLSGFSEIVRHATPLSWTRDPFDRLIVATALADNAQLLTRDATILSNFPGAIWG